MDNIIPYEVFKRHKEKQTLRQQLKKFGLLKEDSPSKRLESSVHRMSLHKNMVETLKKTGINIPEVRLDDEDKRV